MNKKIFELIKSDLIESNGDIAKAACKVYTMCLSDCESSLVSSYGIFTSSDDVYIKIFNYFTYVYNQIVEHGLDAEFKPLHWKWHPCLDGDNPFNRLKKAYIIESQDNTKLIGEYNESI